jgi:hypothetical protein
MGRHILKGFVGFSKLFQAWLSEADAAGLLKKNLNFRGIADFIIITLNGAATLYMSTRESRIPHQTNDQLSFFIGQLRKNDR